MTVLIDTIEPSRLGSVAAAVVDLPHGHHDDPEGRQGLAALTARWIANPPGSAPDPLPVRHGWRTRHQLEAHASSFSYWSALGDLGGLPDHLASRFRPPTVEQTAALARAQLHLIRARSGNLYLRMLDAIEAAAFGDTANSALGTEESLARISPEDVVDYLDRSRNRGIALYGADASDRPATTPWVVPAAPGPRWTGGLVTAPVARESRTRVAVRLPLSGPEPLPGAVELLVELLGTGLEGRLIRRLRGERALAYGTAALSWNGEDRPGIGGYALVAPGDVAAAARTLLTELRTALVQPPSCELASAALRCRSMLLAQVDQPFGAVDEERRRVLGRPGLVRLAHAVGRRAQEGLSVRLAAAARPAIAVVGALDPSQLSEVEALL